MLTPEQIIAQGAFEAYSAVAQALGFASTDEASPADVVDRARELVEKVGRLRQIQPTNEEMLATVRRLANDGEATLISVAQGWGVLAWRPGRGEGARELTRIGTGKTGREALQDAIDYLKPIPSSRLLAGRVSALVSAGADRDGDRAEGCDCANPPPFPGADGAWGVSVACPVHGDGEEEQEEPIGVGHLDAQRGRTADTQAQKDDDVEAQNAVAREIGHALGDKTPERLAVTPSLALRLAQVHALREAVEESMALLRDRDTSLTPVEYRQRAEDDATRAQRLNDGALVREVLLERNGRWMLLARLAPPEVHPADCQGCSEDDDPCAMHAQDWRYWADRALDAEDREEDRTNALGACR